MFKSLCYLTAFFVAFSCAQTSKKPVKKGPKVYGQDVEDEFSSIENGTNSRQEVLEYYRRLRQQNWNKYKKGSGSDYAWKKRKARPKRVSPRQRPTRKLAPIPKRTPKPLAAALVKEMKIEISQYMSYFCMQNRKSSRFSDSADCSAYTQDILRKCENKYPVISDRSLVKCVRTRLR